MPLERSARCFEDSTTSPISGEDARVVLVKRYGIVFLAMSLALAATGLVAGTESADPASDGRQATVVRAEWTPEVESYVARLVASGIPSSGECPLPV